MNPPKWDDLDYIHFLIAAQKVFTCTEAARCAPEGERAPAHDAFTRLLPRQPSDTEALGQEAKAFVDVGKGLLVLDDMTLDKPYAQKYGSGDLSLEWQASAGGQRDRAFDLALDGGEGPHSEGWVVHRKGFGLVRVFRTVSPNGDAEYGATNDLKMTEEKRQELEKKGWG
jgi:hypothetical protein